MKTEKVNSASTVVDQKTIILDCLEKNITSKFCHLKNIIHLCSANSFNVVIYAKVLSVNKKAAYWCKSRDFSAYVETVCSDRLSFIYSKTF
ncbi:MAG: hypothetical protein RR137_09755 [Odoribacter sp.]